MAKPDSWAVMNGAARVLDAQDARIGISAILTPGASLVAARAGLRPGPGDPLRVAATSPTPGPNITVQPGQMVLGASRGNGAYLTTSDTVDTVAILDVPAHASQQRNDLVVARQSDTFYGDASTAYTITRVLGVPGSGDPNPTTGGLSPDYVLLARIRITPGAGAVTTSMIDDLRPGWTTALGGLLPVRGQAERDAMATPYDGMSIWRSDRDWTEVWDGIAWRVQRVAICTSTADRDAAITHPANGQWAITTDSGTLWQRHSGTWREHPAPPLAQLRQTTSQGVPNTTFVAIQFQTEDHDTHGGHDNVTTNTRYTAQRAGRYEFSGATTTAAGLGFRANYWKKNGTVVDASQNSGGAHFAGATQPLVARTIQITLAVGDYVELWLYQDTGGSLSTAVAGGEIQSHMSVKYIGA